MLSNYKNIRPLVIGLGVAGKRHLEAQLDLGIKTGVYTTNPQTAKSLRKKKDVIVFDNLEDGINWSNLVHVCTPDDKHTKFIALALKKGKTIFCEKSFTTNLKDALALQKLAHEYNATVIVGQNYRLTPTFVETKRKILDAQLGAIIKIETTYLHDASDYQKKYSSKNFLYTGGSHAVDLAYWIIGKPVVSVKATSATLLSYNIDITYSSGLSGNIKLDANSSRVISGTDLIVYGEKGKLVSHNKSDKLLFHENGTKNPQTVDLPNTTTFTIPKEIKIIDDFLLGKNNSHQPLPGIDDVVEVIKILDAALRSVSSGKGEFV